MLHLSETEGPDSQRVLLISTLHPDSPGTVSSSWLELTHLDATTYMYMIAVRRTTNDQQTNSDER